MSDVEPKIKKICLGLLSDSGRSEDNMETTQIPNDTNETSVKPKHLKIIGSETNVCDEKREEDGHSLIAEGTGEKKALETIADSALSIVNGNEVSNEIKNPEPKEKDDAENSASKTDAEDLECFDMVDKIVYLLDLKSSENKKLRKIGEISFQLLKYAKGNAKNKASLSAGTKNPTISGSNIFLARSGEMTKLSATSEEKKTINDAEKDLPTCGEEMVSD